MFRILIKDLRISPLRTFLTGFSMYIGIIAMISAVLVGTLGRKFITIYQRTDFRKYSNIFN